MTLQIMLALRYTQRAKIAHLTPLAVMFGVLNYLQHEPNSTDSVDVPANMFAASDQVDLTIAQKIWRIVFIRHFPTSSRGGGDPDHP